MTNRLQKIVSDYLIMNQNPTIFKTEQICVFLVPVMSKKRLASEALGWHKFPSI